MIRSVPFWISIVTSTIGLGILTFITFPFDRNGNIIHHYARWWAKIQLLVSGVRVKVRGLEYIGNEPSYVYMSNHQGNYDIFTLLSCLPVQFRWIAKKELFAIPILGWAMGAANYISIDRSDKRKALESIEKAANKIKEGVSVIIFPEGTRSRDGSIQPFKRGGFTLAIKSGVPIIPITINGSRDVMPRDSMRVRPGEIRVSIDKAIQTTSFTLRERNLLMEKVRGTLDKNFVADWG
ncbi:MAG: 1-acyl-sn-glycerol-3-phosphate acyltransferase [Syntrophobacterales bacterium]|nr:MAG: 1-acyl-sn-glycerol-3-phosphate acyltransferase [Syntrophobacterales bacterium]